MNKPVDIHRAFGLKIEKSLKNYFMKINEPDALPFIRGVAAEVARTEREKARKRREKAAQHALNKDLFND